MNPLSLQPFELRRRHPYGLARAAVVLAYGQPMTPLSFSFGGGLCWNPEPLKEAKLTVNSIAARAHPLSLFIVVGGAEARAPVASTPPFHGRGGFPAFSSFVVCR